MTVGDPLSTTGFPRPDPARGVFETLLVADGRPVELDAHLDRLAASARELYGDGPAARIAGPARALALARAAELEPGGVHVKDAERSPALGRLRVTLAPAADGRLDLEAVAEPLDPALPFPRPARAAALASVVLDGGLGHHKWADRRGLELARERLGAQPLIVDDDGSVLEAERANVFAVVDGTLVTPPADGRILGGIARRRVLEIARELALPVAERRLALAELQNADELLLTGSLRGVEPIAAVDGVARQPGGRATERLAARLRERWLA